MNTPLPPTRQRWRASAARAILALLLLSVLLLGWLTGAMDGPQSALNNAALPFYRDPSLQPRWDLWSSWQRTARFSLIDQHQRAIDQSILERGPSVIGFFYTGCVSLCPISLEVLRGLENLLRKDPGGALPHFLLLTVNPEFDSAPALSDYAKRLSLPPDWTLATGKSSEVYGLANSLLSDIRTPASGGEPPHAQRAFLLDAGRRIRGVYDASSMPEMTRMAADYRRLIASSAAGTSRN